MRRIARRLMVAGAIFYAGALGVGSVPAQSLTGSRDAVPIMSSGGTAVARWAEGIPVTSL